MYGGFPLKRLFSLLMVLMLAAALSLPVWADDDSPDATPTPSPTPNTSTSITESDGVYVTGYTVTTPAGGEITTLGVGDKVNKIGRASCRERV